MSFKSINPFSEELIKEYPSTTYNVAESQMVESKEAFLDWSTQSIYKRILPIYNIADILEQKANEIAALMAAEMGKPISEGIAEIEKCIWLILELL